MLYVVKLRLLPQPILIVYEKWGSHVNIDDDCSRYNENTDDSVNVDDDVHDNDNDNGDNEDKSDFPILSSI